MAQATILQARAVVLADLGRDAAAGDALAQGRTAAQAAGHGELLLRHAVAAVHVSTLAGRPEESRAECEALLRRWPGSRMLQVQALAVIAEAWVAQGDGARGQEAARTCYELAVADGVPHEALVAQRVLGRVALLEDRPADAVGHLRPAVEGFLHAGARLEWGRTLIHLADALDRLRRTDESRAHRAEARQVFTESGAAGDLRRMDDARADLTAARQDR